MESPFIYDYKRKHQRMIMGALSENQNYWQSGHVAKSYRVPFTISQCKKNGFYHDLQNDDACYFAFKVWKSSSDMFLMMCSYVSHVYIINLCFMAA